MGGRGHDSGARGDSARRIRIADLEFEPYIDEQQLIRGVDRVADQLCERYSGRLPLMVAVLNGGAVFHADLVRRMPIPLEVDYVRVSSYQGSTASSGTVNFSAMPGTQPSGRNVIIVEDIVDTGRTAGVLRRYFQQNAAASVEVAALLYKPDADIAGRPPEYAAFNIPNRFVVGYGLDYQGQGRNLRSIFALSQTSDDGPPGADQGNLKTLSKQTNQEESDEQ